MRDLILRIILWPWFLYRWLEVPLPEDGSPW